MYVFTKRTIAIALTTGCMAFGAHAALAQAQAQPEQAQPQQAQPQHAPQTQAAPSAPVSDTKVKKFVTAYSEMEEVRADFSNQLQGVEDAEEATAIQQEAQTKMREAVTETGLSVDEYQELAARINSDDELRDRVQKELME